MTAEKTAKKLQASDVEVGNRTLEGALLDLADQMKANDARCTKALEAIEQLGTKSREVLEEIRHGRAEMRDMGRAIIGISQEHKGLAKRTGEIEQRAFALEKA